MNLDITKIKELKRLIESPKKITVVSHTNPDGDAIGSGLAWTEMLESMGHDVKFIVPNNFPYFLGWMSLIDKVNIFKKAPEQLAQFVEESELIFCMDFNQIGRLEALSDAINNNIGAKKILIDHHLTPPNIYDIELSETAASSTAYLTFKIIEALEFEQKLNYAVAEALYVGISTDTGNFTFGNLTPDLFRTIAKLVEKGVNTPLLNIAIYNNFSEHRMKLMGYILHEKMEILNNPKVAYMSLTNDELNKFNYTQGDTEGFVNLPLSIHDVPMSALFIETKDCIKVSLRSQGDIDVNLFARAHFNGGGHKNAAGGKFFGSMEEAITTFINTVKEL